MERGKNAFWWKQQHSEPHCTQVEESIHTGKTMVGWKGKKNCLLVEAAALGTALHTGGEEHTHTGKMTMGWKGEKPLPSGQNEMTVKWK